MRLDENLVNLASPPIGLCLYQICSATFKLYAPIGAWKFQIEMIVSPGYQWLGLWFISIVMCPAAFPVHRHDGAAIAQSQPATPSGDMRDHGRPGAHV